MNGKGKIISKIPTLSNGDMIFYLITIFTAITITTTTTMY